MNDSRGPAPIASHDAVLARVKATIRPKIRALKAYPVAKATGMIKLDAMENPYGLSGEARAEIAAAVANARINRYPDGPGDEVKGALRRSLKLADDVALVLGNGSDEILQMLTAAVAKPGAVVLAPEPSFVLYRMQADLANLRFVGVPLRADLSLDVEAMLAAIERNRPALVWLAYPNNPTGTLFASARRRSHHRGDARPGCVDEAYYAFADATYLPRVLSFRTSSSCERSRKSAWPVSVSATPAGHPLGSRSSTRCVRRTTSTRSPRRWCRSSCATRTCWPSRPPPSAASGRAWQAPSARFAA
jgi:hypothetical protein